MIANKITGDKQGRVVVNSEYQTVPRGINNGDYTSLQADNNGNLRVTLASKIAGENFTDDLIRVEPKYKSARLNGETILSVKQGAGVIHSIIMTKTGTTPTAKTLINLYDGLITGGNLFYIDTINAGQNITLDIEFNAGLRVEIPSILLDADIVLIYR